MSGAGLRARIVGSGPPGGTGDLDLICGPFCIGAGERARIGI